MNAFQIDTLPLLQLKTMKDKTMLLNRCLAQTMDQFKIETVKLILRYHKLRYIPFHFLYFLSTYADLQGAGRTTYYKHYSNS